jgi:hypothetical protein
VAAVNAVGAEGGGGGAISHHHHLLLDALFVVVRCSVLARESPAEKQPARAPQDGVCSSLGGGGRAPAAGPRVCLSVRIRARIERLQRAYNTSKFAYEGRVVEIVV